MPGDPNDPMMEIYQSQHALPFGTPISPRKPDKKKFPAPRRPEPSDPKGRVFSNFAPRNWEPPKQVQLANHRGFKDELRQFFNKMEGEVMRTSPDLLASAVTQRLGIRHFVAYVERDPRGKVVRFLDLLDYLDDHWVSVFTEVYRGVNVFQIRYLRRRIEKLQQWMYSSAPAHALTSADLALSVEEHHTIWHLLAETEKDRQFVRQCYTRWKQDLTRLLGINQKLSLESI